MIAERSIFRPQFLSRPRRIFRQTTISLSACALIKEASRRRLLSQPDGAGADIPEMSMSTLLSLGLLVKSSLRFSSRGTAACGGLQSLHAAEFSPRRKDPTPWKGYFPSLFSPVLDRTGSIPPLHRCRYIALTDIAPAFSLPPVPRGMPAPAGRIWHDRRRRQIDLRRQGEIAPGSAAQLLPSQKPRSQGGTHPSAGAHARLGVRRERVRGPVARTGIDPPLAATLQRAGTAAPPPAHLRLRGSATGSHVFLAAAHGEMSWPASVDLRRTAGCAAVQRSTTASPCATVHTSRR